MFKYLPTWFGSWFFVLPNSIIFLVRYIPPIPVQTIEDVTVILGNCLIVNLGVLLTAIALYYPLTTISMLFCSSVASPPYSQTNSTILSSIVVRQYGIIENGFPPQFKLQWQEVYYSEDWLGVLVFFSGYSQKVDFCTALVILMVICCNILERMAATKTHPRAQLAANLQFVS